MTRLLRYWVVLAPAAVAATYGTTLLVFRHVDLSFAQFAVLLVAPLAQASALALEAEPPWRSLAETGGALARHPMARPIAALDVLVIGAGVIAWSRHVVGFGAGFNVQATWIAVKLAAATTLLLAGVAAGAGHGRRARAALAACAVVSALSGLEAAFGWSRPLSASVERAAGRVPLVFVQLVVFGTLFAAGVGAVLVASRALSRSLPSCARLGAIAIACMVPAAAAVALAIFDVPVVRQPWRGAALLFTSLGASAMLFAGVMAAWPQQTTCAEAQAR